MYFTVTLNSFHSTYSDWGLNNLIFSPDKSILAAQQHCSNPRSERTQFSRKWVSVSLPWELTIAQKFFILSHRKELHNYKIIKLLSAEETEKLNPELQLTSDFHLHHKTTLRTSVRFALYFYTFSWVKLINFII